MLTSQMRSTDNLAARELVTTDF